MNPVELKKEFGESTLKVIILGVVTLGAYFYIWITERRKKINELAGKEVFSLNLLIAAAVCSGVSDIAIYIQFERLGILYSYNIFAIAHIVIITIIAWRIASFLELYLSQTNKIDVKLNKFLIIGFNIFYINYFFNTLDEMQNIAATEKTKITI